MDTVRRRWERLYPHIEALGPDDDAMRPAVLIFHGCGGVRGHLRRYALEAVRAGWRAFLVDSYGPRGWSKKFAQYLVCTGVLLRGYERSGDVLAAAWGVAQWPGVDPNRLMLAGWSHGSWAIMDLMTMGLLEPGEADLADPSPEPMRGVKGLFLAYPYGGYPALSRTREWVWKPRSYAVIARQDHVTSQGAAERLYERIRGQGVEIETWSIDATHAFDEPTANVPMRADPLLAAESHRRFTAFLEGLTGKAKAAAA
jgi:dienelactone hydrolase